MPGCQCVEESELRLNLMVVILISYECVSIMCCVMLNLLKKSINFLLNIFATYVGVLHVTK